jgi:hypothetical protein
VDVATRLIALLGIDPTSGRERDREADEHDPAHEAGYHDPWQVAIPSR